jgi:hypothetical protein
MTAEPVAIHLQPEHALARARPVALGVGVAAGALVAVGGFLDPEQGLRSYLVAYVFWLGIPLGCLAILMISHVTGGLWGVVVRRLLEAGARTLLLMGPLFLPIFFGLGYLYEWAHPEVVAHDPLLQHKALYLNAGFFRARAFVYFGAWLLLAELLRRWSLRQDLSEHPLFHARRLETLSRGGLVLLGLTMTFASIDWMMSLEPHWFSTIYGVLYMGGSVLSAFAVVIPVAVLLAERGPLGDVIVSARLHDLGNLLLAFVMLWAYFNLSQFLIIWSGNLPEEIPWYLARFRGGWQWIALVLVAFNFALPFLVLLSRRTKRRARRLATVAAALIGLRLVDLYWLVQPAFHPGHLTVHWLDVVTVAAIGGLWVATFLTALGGPPLVPLRDPSLEAEA